MTLNARLRVITVLCSRFTDLGLKKYTQYTRAHIYMYIRIYHRRRRPARGDDDDDDTLLYVYYNIMYGGLLGILRRRLRTGRVFFIL